MSEDRENHWNFYDDPIAICTALLVSAVVVGVIINGLMGWEEPETTPNLYELTRQTAENTRHIFWLIVAGFVCLFGIYMPMLIKRKKAT